jgi:adenosine deaminase
MIGRFIHALPKTETHLHVEGALPYELLTAWRPARYAAAPAFRERSYRYATFPAFENTARCRTAVVHDGRALSTRPAG